MKNVPKKIYLQIGDDCPSDVDFNELVGVSWCSDRINDNDIEFMLVTRVCPDCNGLTAIMGTDGIFRPCHCQSQTVL